MKDNRFNECFENCRLSDKINNLIFTLIIFLLVMFLKKLI